MKGIQTILILMLLFSSCKKENPSPSGFFEYSLPYYKNMDSQLLLQLDHNIKQGVFGDIQSLIIIRNDNIVFENYYGNNSRNDMHPIGAATQSIISALVGIQDLEDPDFSLSTKIVDLLPEYKAYFDNIPQKDQIEIKHLLSHSSGLWWDEWTHPFGTEDNDAYIMSLSDDWITNVLSTPMIREPGNEFNFNSGNAVLMAPLLQNTRREDLESMAKEKLFAPLSIADWKWEKIPGDFVNSAWGLHLRPIDFAKIGYLYLHNGVLNDQVLFKENWVGRSTLARYNVSSYFNYGYFWWKFTQNADAIKDIVRNDVFFAWGEGGQFLFVVPHLQLVVVTTAGNYNSNDTKAIEMLRDFILVSVNDRFQ